jgi:erythromycin esterase-like protein
MNELKVTRERKPDVRHRVSDKATSTLIAEAAEPLPDFDDPAFGALFDRFADKRVVLLGEASHGTSEFYRARAAITRRLVEAHGFSIVALEADWPDAASIDRQRARSAGARSAPIRPSSAFRPGCGATASSRASPPG